MSDSFTRFRSEPASHLQDKWMETIRKTGQPELCDELFRGRLPNDVEYRILKRVDIDRRKRPKGDLAPCPMCTSNRFLRGSLVYVESLQCAAVIGHCCAVHAEQAERQYQITQRIKWEEDYLLAALPYIASKQRAVTDAKCIAEEVQRIYRRLRNQAPDVHGILRSLKERNNARLTLYDDEEETKPTEYVGPAGFRGAASKRGAREISFGSIIGTTALIRDYKPVTELNDVARNIGVFDFEGDELTAIEFIGKLSAKERSVSVATLQLADNNYEKFVTRIRDCISFFAPESVSRLKAFGSHPLNDQPFDVAVRRVGSNWNFELKSGQSRCFSVINGKIFSFDFSWKLIPYEKRP